jgi:hypothetical protein
VIPLYCSDSIYILLQKRDEHVSDIKFGLKSEKTELMDEPDSDANKHVLRG